VFGAGFMKRFLVLAFALLFVTAIQVVPQVDLTDGDAGFSYAILSKSHFHPPSSTNLANLSAQRFRASDQAATRGYAGPDMGTTRGGSSPMATVLRC
jgi:hypothetical protein